LKETAAIKERIDQGNLSETSHFETRRNEVKALVEKGRKKAMRSCAPQ